MFKEFFNKYPDFEIDTPNLTLEKYSNKLPNELIKFIKKYGTGTYMEGFLKFINPDDYQDVLNEAYLNINNEIVFAITAFGDFMVWGNDFIRLIKFKYGTDNIIETGDDMEWFFNMDLADDSYVKDIFEFDKYKRAKKKFKNLKIGECFGYIPLLPLGGKEKIKNIDIVKIKEHIHLISQLVGKIE